MQITIPAVFFSQIRLRTVLFQRSLFVSDAIERKRAKGAVQEGQRRVGCCEEETNRE
jgi:hypothetical protein